MNFISNLLQKRKINNENKTKAQGHLVLKTIFIYSVLESSLEKMFSLQVDKNLSAKFSEKSVSCKQQSQGCNHQELTEFCSADKQTIKDTRDKLLESFSELYSSNKSEYWDVRLPLGKAREAGKEYATSVQENIKGISYQKLRDAMRNMNYALPNFGLSDLDCQVDNTMKYLVFGDLTSQWNSAIQTYTQFPVMREIYVHARDVSYDIQSKCPALPKELRIALENIGDNTWTRSNQLNYFYDDTQYHGTLSPLASFLSEHTSTDGVSQIYDAVKLHVPLRVQRSLHSAIAKMLADEKQLNR